MTHEDMEKASRFLRASDFSQLRKIALLLATDPEVGAPMWGDECLSKEAQSIAVLLRREMAGESIPSGDWFIKTVRMTGSVIQDTDGPFMDTNEDPDPLDERRTAVADLAFAYREECFVRESIGYSIERTENVLEKLRGSAAVQDWKEKLIQKIVGLVG